MTEETLKKAVVLAVAIEGNSPVCLACAEQIANAGFPSLFWIFNPPKRVAAETICSCGKPMDNQQAEEAAARIVALLEEGRNKNGKS